ncbi:MAG: outer membrane beta-barrel protein [Acidobacteria bacterium]|nr:outer membrane beta-barrel protein [Acidobacteriota bacterium]
MRALMVLMLCGSALVFAQGHDTKGFYIGFSAGFDVMDDQNGCDCDYWDDEYYDHEFDDSDVDFSRSFRIGYSFNRFLALEWSRFDLKADGDDWILGDRRIYSVDGTAFKVRGSAPLGDHVDFFGQIGLHYAEVEGRELGDTWYNGRRFSYDDVSRNFGTGFAFHIGESTALNLEWNLYKIAPILDWDEDETFDVYEFAVAWRWTF